MFIVKMINPINFRKTDNVDVKPKTTLTLFGIEIDNKLYFKQQFDALYHKASFKTNSLKQIRNYLNAGASETNCRYYIHSNFLYCPFIWMFGCKYNTKSRSRNSL